MGCSASAFLCSVSAFVSKEFLIELFLFSLLEAHILIFIDNRGNILEYIDVSDQ